MTCPDLRRARRTASAQFEVVMQFSFQQKFLYTIAVRGLLRGASLMVHQMRVLVVANEMGHVNLYNKIKLVAVNIFTPLL